MDSPLIDILVPTYEPIPSFLHEAIGSAIDQTEQCWRMMIHDDRSVANVEAMVQPYLHDPRITFIRSTQRLGIGSNWNACVKLGSAPYVQFLFQDDVWDPEFLSRGLNAMEEHPEVGMVSLGHSYITGEKETMPPSYEHVQEFRQKELTAGLHDGRETLRFWLERGLYPNIIGEPDFVMLRRSVLEEAGPFLEDMVQNLDVEHAIRCLRRADWYYVKEQCGYFRVHGRGASALHQREGKGMFDRFRCFEELIRALPRGPDRLLAIDARNRALTDMAHKFIRRLRGGKALHVGGGGSGSFRRFAMRHPLLVAEALMRAYTMR